MHMKSFCSCIAHSLVLLYSHPHVIGFRECFLTSKHLAIVMEYVAGGNLHQLVNRQGGLSEKLARWFFQQLIVALDYCHKVVYLIERLQSELHVTPSQLPGSCVALDCCHKFGQSTLIRCT